MKTLKLKTAILAFFISTAFHLLAQPVVSTRFNFRRGSYKNSYYDVTITKNGKEKNLTWFKPWEEINETELSPDNRYLFVRHKPQGGKSYLLSLYDLRTMKLVKTIAPGFGGEFHWNGGHQIVHDWGCGTNCANLIVYDLNLRKIFFTLSSGGFMFSPDYRYAAQFSMHADKTWVFDLYSLGSGKHPLTFAIALDSIYDSNTLVFTSPTRFRITTIEGKTGKRFEIDLEKVKMKRTDPEKIGEFYLRDFK